MFRLQTSFSKSWLAYLCVLAFFVPHATFAEQQNQIRFPTSEELLLTLKRAEALLGEEKFEEALDLYMRVLEADRKNPKDANRLVEIEETTKVLEIKRGEQTVKYPQWVLAKQKKRKKTFDRPRTGYGLNRHKREKFVPRRFKGLTRFIQQRLLALPDKVVSLYQERFDYRAKAALTAAIESGKKLEIEAVYHQYILSQYAIKALEHLAEKMLEEGATGDAGRLYETLSDKHRWFLDVDSRRSYLEKCALAYALDGNIPAVKRVCQSLGKSAGGVALAYGQQSLTVDQLLQLAAALTSAKQKKQSQALSQVMGDAQHSNSFSKGLGVGQPRFELVPFARPVYQPRSPFSPRIRRSNFNTIQPSVILAKRRRMNLQGKTERVLEPCALLSTGTQLVTTWLKDGKPGPKVYSPTRESYNEKDDKVLHGGASANGVFVTSFVMRVKERQAFRQIPITVDQPMRKLCALDTKRWRWVWNHEDLLRKTRFENASFPSPPVIVQDTVYASAILIEGFVQSYVMAFDLQTGALKWATWVCSGQVEQTMFGEQAREPLVSPVSYKDGKVFHCSSLGAVACLDARTGIPDWVTTYDQVTIKPPKSFYPQKRQLGWGNTPPIAADNYLVVAPLDADLAVAYDVSTGKQVWTTPRGQSYVRGGCLERLVAVGQGKVVFSAQNKIQVVDLKTGRLLANQALQNRVMGRGIIANNQFCVILNGSASARNRSVSHLAVYDLRDIQGGTLKLMRSDPLRRNPGGDLFLFDDTVFVLRGRQISAYTNRVPVKPRVSQQREDF